MEPSGERCEVPVIPKKEIPEQNNVDKNLPDSGLLDDVADMEKKIEHQYVMSSRKIDGTKIEHETQNPNGKPKTGSETASAKATVGNLKS